MNQLILTDKRQTQADSTAAVQEENLKVSIIIPAFNMAEFIEEAILSVLQGEMHDVEVIVVDDGSEDETPEIVAQFINPGSQSWDPRVRYHRKENQGKSVAVNLGLELAMGEYITILDADDKLPMDSLQIRYDHASEGAPDLIIGAFNVFNKDQIFGTRTIKAGLNRNTLLKKYIWSYQSPFSVNACLFSRRLIQQVGGLDRRLIRCQDIDLALRLLDKSNSVKTIDHVVYNYRKHRQSLKERLRVRVKTMYYRQIALRKNIRGWTKYPLIVVMFVLDFAKLLFELRGR